MAGIETLLNKVFDAVRNRLRADVEVTAALPAGANKIGVVDAQLLGSTIDLRGLAANKPAANAVAIGATYWSVDTDPHGTAIEVSDGTNWAVI